VDDEYWEHPDPTKAFKQPEGKPSKVTALVKAIELFEILSSAQDAFVSRGFLWRHDCVAHNRF
jgi:hypothetical protein